MLLCLFVTLPHNPVPFVFLFFYVFYVFYVFFEVHTTVCHHNLVGSSLIECERLLTQQKVSSQEEKRDPTKMEVMLKMLGIFFC